MQDEFGDTPLLEACDQGHLKTASVLIEKGAYIDFQNKVGCHNTLHVQINFGN